MTDPVAVVVERDLPFPPARVWRALTEPHLLAEWLMPNDFRPEVGHAFTLRGEWGSVQGRVIEARPPEALSYAWDHPHPDPAFDLRSTVTFTLTPTAAGTRLRVEQVGFAPGQRQAIGGARMGWARNIEALERALAGAA